MAQDTVRHELSIDGEHNVVDWFQFCIDLPVDYFMHNQEQIGGPGHVVEIDESLFARRKYNSGRLIPGQWIFGCYNQQKKHGFLITVAQRDAATLLPIIHERIALGTEIRSDMWGCGQPIMTSRCWGTVNRATLILGATMIMLSW